MVEVQDRRDDLLVGPPGIVKSGEVQVRYLLKDRLCELAEKRTAISFKFMNDQTCSLMFNLMSITRAIVMDIARIKIITSRAILTTDIH